MGDEETNQVISCTVATMISMYHQAVIRLNLVCLLHYFYFLSLVFIKAVSAGASILAQGCRDCSSPVSSASLATHGRAHKWPCQVQAIEGNRFLPFFVSQGFFACVGLSCSSPWGLILFQNEKAPLYTLGYAGP